VEVAVKGQQAPGATPLEAARARYIAALKRADQRDLAPLVGFVRS
jgi:hypothetical protein